VTELHPFRDVAIVGAYNTPQARSIDGHNSRSITFAAGLGALADAGLTLRDVDGFLGFAAGDFSYQARSGPVWRLSACDFPGILAGAGAIAAGLASVVLAATGGAGVYVDRGATAPWTRPSNEFVAPFGMYTAAEFALIARRHMHLYGTTPHALATVAATIRNNGHVNPKAIYCGRGPFTPDDILASRMVADPFHLLDCAMTSEGGTAIVLARADVAEDLPTRPVYSVGGGCDSFGPAYQHPPASDLGGRGRSPDTLGSAGRRAARSAFAMAGMTPDDIDVCEMYDPFSFEIIRQFEAFGFCAEGEGGDYVTSGVIQPGGRHPINTEGGLMSFSHGGGDVQKMQRVVRAVQQLRGECESRQVDDASNALCSAGGSGALYNDVILLSSGRP
jgi:acetyl-CoA acetyltransferase